MHICFEYSPLGVNSPATPDQSLAGSEYQLAIHRRDATGPVYPHIWEQSDPKFFAFFAGRIAGELQRDAFPAGHAVSVRDASDWTMTPEPDGSWLALKFDRERDILSFAADFCLLQRWYYTQRGESWFISNSLLYLKELLGAALCVNERAIPYMLTRGYLPLDQTPLSGVYVLQSGRSLTIEGGSCRIERRLEPAYFFNESLDLDLSTVPKRIQEALTNAVAAEITQQDEVCIPLSGGIDSRFLLGCALELLPKEKITAITFGHLNSLDFRIGAGLAKQIGVRSIQLPFDERPVSELLQDNLKTVEGTYWCFPNHPVSGLRDVLKEFPFILSGYIGDLVFGSYDLSPEECAMLETGEQYFLSRIHEISDVVDLKEARALLVDKDADPLRTDQIYAGYRASSRENAFAMWLWEDHLFNRTNFAVELHRDLAFYSTPFVHQNVLRLAYRLPKSNRLEQRAYLNALRQAYPDLWKYPSKNNYGFSFNKNARAQIWTTRAYRKAMVRADNLLGSFTGRIHYHHPMNNYEHSRELMQERHREDVLAALKRLRERDAFQSDAMSALIGSYEKRKPLNKELLYGLLTIDLWYRHYEG